MPLTRTLETAQGSAAHVRCGRLRAFSKQEGIGLKKRILTLCVMTAVFIGAAGCSSGESAADEKQNPEETVLYLDGDAVTEDEYALLAAEYRNQVTMQYPTDQVNADDFWQTEIGGETPLSQLEELVLEQLKYNYAVKHLAVESGVTENYTYAGLQKKQESENKERSEQLEDDETVYGLTSYDASAYYNYWYSNLETQWKNSWIPENADIRESECRDYYEEHEDIYTYDTGVTVIYAELPYDSESEHGEMQNTALSLSRALETVDDITKIEDAFPEIEFEELELNDFDTREGMSGVYALRWEKASGLKEGQVAAPYEDNGAVCVMKCIRRTENGRLEFDDVKSRIERMFQVQAADQCISETKENIKVENGNISAEAVLLRTVHNQQADGGV